MGGEKCEMVSIIKTEAEENNVSDFDNVMETSRRIVDIEDDEKREILEKVRKKAGTTNWKACVGKEKSLKKWNELHWKALSVIAWARHRDEPVFEELEDTLRRMENYKPEFRRITRTRFVLRYDVIFRFRERTVKFRKNKEMLCKHRGAFRFDILEMPVSYLGYNLEPVLTESDILNLLRVSGSFKLGDINVEVMERQTELWELDSNLLMNSISFWL